MSNPNPNKLGNMESRRRPASEALTAEQWAAERQHRREVARGMHDDSMDRMLHNRYSDKADPTR